MSQNLRPDITTRVNKYFDQLPESAMRKEAKPAASQFLLSPPELQRPDTFAVTMQDSTLPPRTPTRECASLATPITFSAGPLRSLISPPISPGVDYKNNFHKRKDSRNESERDPPLFSNQGSTEQEPELPLFPQSGRKASFSEFQRRYVETGQVPTEAQEREAAETLSNMKFQSCVMEQWRRDPVGWAKGSRDTERFYKDLKMKSKANGPASNTSKKPAVNQLAPSLDGGIRKKASVPAIKRVRVKRPAPQPLTESNSPLKIKINVKPTVPRPPKLNVSRDAEFDFESIPDYCPPLSTLDSQPRALRADWKSHPKRINEDAHFDLLHEQEAHVASVLRLTPAQYLTSKRYIFQARVASGKKGQEFRKTHAQQACNIDVNKASRLHLAFERVGWFQDKWFTKWVNKGGPA